MITTNIPPPSPNPKAAEAAVAATQLPTWNSRVRTCDGLTGRISFVWRVHQPSTINHQRFYYRVSFPPGSPYFDDWTVYRQFEVTLIPVAANVSSI